MRTFSILFGILVLSGCSNLQQLPSEDDSSMSSVSSMISSTVSSSSGSTEYEGPPPIDQSTHSGTYINTEYGFSLEYPTHYEPLGQPHWNVYRMYNSRVVDNVLEHDEQFALFARAARDREIPSELSMTIAIYPLENYSYLNIYDDEYLYNKQSDSWTRATSKEPFKPKSRTYNGVTMYEFFFGDAGYSERTFAILNREKNIVVEIDVAGCLGCIKGSDGFDSLPQEQYDELAAHEAADTELILHSFRWINE